MNEDGFLAQRCLPEIAYDYREGLRLREWDRVLASIRRYREIRTAVCNDYMSGSHEILSDAEAMDGTAFPLGAGGGGGVLIFASDPSLMKPLREKLARKYHELTFRIRSKGHELLNLPIGSAKATRRKNEDV